VPSLVHLLQYSPSPFLKWLQQVSVFCIHTYIENTSVVFTLIYSPLPLVPSPYHDLFSIPVPYCFKYLLLFSGVLPWYFTCKSVVL
jgi:hypothetical protein